MQFLFHFKLGKYFTLQQEFCLNANGCGHLCTV